MMTKHTNNLRQLLLAALLLSGLLFGLVMPGLSYATSRGLQRVEILNSDGKSVGLYQESHALLIGVSKYNNGWPGLPGVKRDLKVVRKAMEQQGFHVVEVNDPDDIELRAAFTEFVRRYGRKPGNRLLFYFAGHGHTMEQAYGGEMGYIVPSNSPNPATDRDGFLDTAFDMQEMDAISKRIQSKHALFLFDSCFSGSVFSLSRAAPKSISYKTARPVRQFITSGSAEEEVPDESIFRQQFIAALNGEADGNDDGYVTGNELGMFLQDKVIIYSNESQHPQYGKIRDPNLDKGDFVFELPQAEGAPKTASSSSNVVQEASLPMVVAGGLDIESLLEECEAHFSANRLTSGAGGNALTCYKEVLDIRRGQPDALTGLSKIEDKYISWVRREIKRNKLAKAKRFLASLILVNKDHQAVGELEDAIEALQSAGQQSTVVVPGAPVTQQNQSQRASYEPEMKLFKGGTFQMGCVTGSECDDDEKVHTVNVASFHMAKTEVTQAQWKAVMGSNPSIFKGDNRPVENVSWNDAQEYIKKLNTRTGKQYRLPTEAEWEYAARGGGNQTKYPWGNQLTHDRANYGAEETSPAGSFAQEGNGLYDTVGNVWEWTASCYAKGYDGSETRHAKASDSCSRVIRGGSWYYIPRNVRSAFRLRLDASYRSTNIGFRLSRTR